MSASSTNVEKQTKRHRPALWGIGAAVAVAAVLLVAYLTVLAERGQPVAEDDQTAIERAVD